METAVKVSTSVTMFSIEEARQQLEAYKNGTLDVEPIKLSNVENMLKSMGDYETLVKLIKGTKENGQDSHLQYIDESIIMVVIKPIVKDEPFIFTDAPIEL